MKYTRIYCSVELARKIMKFVEKNRLGDYWVMPSDDKNFKRYVVVKCGVSPTIVSEFAGQTMRTTGVRDAS